VQQSENVDVEKRVAKAVNTYYDVTAFVQRFTQVLDAAAPQDSELFEKMVASLFICLPYPQSELIGPAFYLIVDVAIEESRIAMKGNSILELFATARPGCLRLWVCNTRTV
jgi:hypothetical protein